MAHLPEGMTATTFQRQMNHHLRSKHKRLLDNWRIKQAAWQNERKKILAIYNNPTKRSRMLKKWEKENKRRISKRRS